MKKILFSGALLLLISLFLPQKVNALVSCPTLSDIMCSDIDSQGGCTPPCNKSVISYDNSGNPFFCKCIETTTPCAKNGESCFVTACCSSAPYCWGSPQVCHTTKPPTPTPQPPGNGTLNCDGTKGILTAIGCIHVLDTPETFLGDILRWAVGIGGGIAFLLILYAGFMVVTSAGNPERLKAGQELLTSAISGLILLIFSVFILKFIGIDILGLCKFGFAICPPQL